MSIKVVVITLGAIGCLGLVVTSSYTPKKTLPIETPIAQLVQSEVVSPKPSPPSVVESAGVPEVTAKAFAIFDVNSGQLIVGKNEHHRLMPASTTKITTALIAMNEYDHDEVVTINRAFEAIGHVVDFVPGEQIRAGDLVKAMMINSGNDAAIALADHHPEGYSTFVDLMNQYVISLGLKNTHFSNVSGVEADDHYSSAYDLAVLANSAMANQTFKKIVATKTDKIYSTDQKYTHQLENLNQLLWEVDGVIGVKTGWTPVAGDCLVTYTSRDHDVITVVLNSTDRFVDSKVLIEWAFENIVWP